MKKRKFDHLKIMDAPLSDQTFTGYWCTDKPNVVVEAHEWEDWEYDYEDSVGAVYYDIIEDGEVVDGGILEYQEDGDSIGDFISFVQEANGVTILAPLGLEGESEFGDLEYVRDNPDVFSNILQME